MKLNCTSVFVVSAFALFFGVSSVSAQLKIDCKSVEERVTTAINEKPENVLTIVEDALVAYSGCVDTIVKSAIVASEADAAMVKQIVLVAVTTAEKEAPQIAEAAVSANPEHADAVREAFAEAFDKKAQTQEKKEIAKNEAIEEEVAPAEMKEAVKESKAPGAEKTVAVQNEVSAPEMNAANRQSAKESPSAENTQTQMGKAVIGEVDLGGKEVVSSSATGKTVLYDDFAKAPVGEEGAAEYESGYHIGSGGSGSRSGSRSYGYGPVDLSGVYLIPPVASAAPIVEEETERKERIRIVRRFQTRNRTIIRSVPMSPTSP